MARGDAAKKSAQSAENKQEEQQSDVQPDQTEQDAQEAAAQQPDGTPQVATAESSDDEQAKPKWYEETQGRCPHPDSYDVVERGANRRSARQVAQANESEAALQS